MPFGIKLDAMILAPLIYIAIIAGSMATFSSLYRKRQARTSLSLPILLLSNTDSCT